MSGDSDGCKGLKRFITGCKTLLKKRISEKLVTSPPQLHHGAIWRIPRLHCYFHLSSSYQYAVKLCRDIWNCCGRALSCDPVTSERYRLMGWPDSGAASLQRALSGIPDPAHVPPRRAAGRCTAHRSDRPSASPRAPARSRPTLRLPRGPRLYSPARGRPAPPAGRAPTCPPPGR